MSLLPSHGSSHNRWIYPFLFIFLSVLGILASILVVYLVYTTNKIHILDRVDTLAQVLPQEEIQALNGTLADFDTPTYESIKQLLTSIRAVNHDVRFAYLIGLHDNGMFFYADSENPASADYSPPGQEYPEATPLMFRVFEHSQSGFELARDRWGFWASAYAPIIDPVSRDVIALIGLDVPGNGYIVDMIIFGLLPLLFVAVILTLISIAQYVRNRERHYIEQKTDFLSITSHEIRSPLTGIRWATENMLTKRDAVLDEYSRKIISLIRDNCSELIDRVNNLLAVTAFENNPGITIKKEYVMIRPMIESIVTSLILTAQSRGVSLVIHNSLPADLSFWSNSEQMRQVFVNLISNAIKYTNLNSKVVISYDKKNGIHHVHVFNQGEPIPAEEQKHIFDGFHRTERAIRSQQYGTGLGLYLAKKVMELHGGTISVSSTLHGGTIFTVSIKDSMREKGATT